MKKLMTIEILLKLLFLPILFLPFTFSYATDNCACPIDYPVELKTESQYYRVNYYIIVDGSPDDEYANCGTGGAVTIDGVYTLIAAETGRIFNHYGDLFNTGDNRKAYFDTYQVYTYCQACTQTDIPFPVNDSNATYATQWKTDSQETITNRQACDDSNGTIENAKITCVDYERCKIPNSENNDTNCTEKDTKFNLLDNMAPLFRWSEPEDRSLECSNIDNTVKLTRRINCKIEYLCALETDEAPKICPESISSYVTPRNQVFHEDISITGTDFGLHYASSEWNSTTIAHGWSISNHSRLEGDHLHYGTGGIRVVDITNIENGLTVILSGSSELLFNAEGKHIQTRDIYTKETQTTFAYDSEDNLITVTNMYNESTTFNRDTNGIITSIEAPNGQITYLAIDENVDLLEVQYEDTTSYTFEYEQHLMTVEREANGNEFLHFFDEQGKVVKVIDAEQGEWDFGTTSDDTSGTHTVTRASGDTITYKNHFLENGILKTEKTLATGDIILYESAIDDSLSATTTCGQTNTNTYLLENGILAKDPLHDRRILETSTQTTPSGLIRTSNYTTNYNFSANDTLISVENITETNGATTTSLRDYNSSTQTITSAQGIVTQSTFDPITQNLLTSQYANLEPTTFTYDDKGRVTEITQGDRTTTSTYDEKGNLASITDPKDQTTTYTYDVLDRVTEITYADGSTELFEYDNNGNQIKRTVPTPADHSFAYNGVNKRINYTSPLQSATTYTYDKQRRITQVSKPSGATIDTTYTDGRVTSIQTPEGTTYYNYECQSKVSSISKDDESLSFTYDGELLTSMSQAGVLTEAIEYSYNTNFIPNDITYSGVTTAYSYNLDNQRIQSGDFSLTRDSINGLTTQLSDGSFTQTRTYNSYGELESINEPRFGYSLVRDTTKITQKTESITPNKKTVTNTYIYSYDNRDRLIEVKEGRKVLESYTYDANGNRASATIGRVTTTASYTLDDQLIVYGDNTYRYDDDGYLEEKITPEGTTTYTYGTMGELKEVITPTLIITYPHNANNQRVAKLINGQIIEKYLWGNLTTLLATYDANDNLIQRFHYVDQRMPISMIQNGQKYYLHYDQVGSLRAVSDSNNNIIKEITYDTYGNILSDSDETFKMPFGFAGGLYDSDTKLTRFGYRDYDAYTGKWTAKDPIVFQGGDSNLYGYVLGDPVGFVDPSGLAGTKVGGRGGVIIIPIPRIDIDRAWRDFEYWWYSSHWWDDVDTDCDTHTLDCDEEKEAARDFCDDIARRNAYGNSWSVGGRNYQECLMGQIPELCGGNRVDYGRR